MFVFKTAIVLACLASIHSQSYNGPTTTPVPILKQINRQNDDGSYSYGYEAADGSFKIETKYPNGDVAGKYGYVDADGKTREVAYGASSQRGFEPQGSDIMVPPPTLHDPSNALSEGQEDDGQYREDPKIYEDPKYNSRQTSRPAQPGFQQYHRTAPAEPEPQYERQRYEEPAPQRPLNHFSFRSEPYNQQLFNQAPQQFPEQNRPQSQIYHQQPQFSYQAYTPQPQYQNYRSQSYQPQQYQNYQPQNYNPFSGHPAQNFDPSTGSYSINFTG